MAEYRHYNGLTLPKDYDGYSLWRCRPRCFTLLDGKAQSQLPRHARRGEQTQWCVGHNRHFSDMREVNAAADEGDERAKLALDMYEHRITKYVGAFTAEMNGVDIIVFTGGVGEHQPRTRANVCRSLGYMGVEIDEAINDANNGEEQIISTKNSTVKVVVIPTDEEYMIAKDTEAIVEGREP